MREKLILNLKIFIFISFISILVIFIKTTSPKTLYALRNTSFIFILLSILTTGMRFFSDIIRSIFISRALGKNLGIRSSTLFILSGQFLGGLTPFQIGGVPLQIYFLKKDGITIPEGSAIILTRGILSAIAFPFFLPFIFLKTGSFNSPVFLGLFYYLLFFYSFFFIIFILIFLGVKIKRFQNLSSGIERFKEIFLKDFAKRKKEILFAFIFTIISLIFYFITAPFILKGLGVNIDFIKVSLLQIILTYSLNFLPTPASSGFAEFGAYGIFKDVCPYELLGIYIILWRFITCYLGVILGGIISSYYLIKRGKSCSCP